MRFSPLLALVLLSCSTSVLLADDDDRRGESRGRPRVTFYEHADFRGGSFTVDVGEVVENLTRLRFSNGASMNDRISSFRIEGDAELEVFHDAGFRGGRERFRHSVANLGDSAPGWNDAISSARVERSRGGGVDPARRDHRQIDAMIRRAYRDILLRDPDEGGLRDYRRHIINDRWTDEQLRHSLRESDEFRAVADRIITKAYRELLRRDPDDRELRRMRDQMIRRSWGEEDVRRAVRQSGDNRPGPRSPHGG